MEFEHTMEFDTTEEMNETFEGGNKNLSNLIVDLTLKNLKTDIKEIPIVSITTKDEDLIYEIMVDRKDLFTTLEQNLDTMEEYEDYERCQKISEALNYLKSN